MRPKFLNLHRVMGQNQAFDGLPKCAFSQESSFDLSHHESFWHTFYLLPPLNEVWKQTFGRLPKCAFSQESSFDLSHHVSFWHTFHLLPPLNEVRNLTICRLAICTFSKSRSLFSNAGGSSIDHKTSFESANFTLKAMDFLSYDFRNPF